MRTIDCGNLPKMRTCAHNITGARAAAIHIEEPFELVGDAYGQRARHDGDQYLVRDPTGLLFVHDPCRFEHLYTFLTEDEIMSDDFGQIEKKLKEFQEVRSEARNIFRVGRFVAIGDTRLRAEQITGWEHHDRKLHVFAQSPEVAMAGHITQIYATEDAAERAMEWMDEAMEDADEPPLLKVGATPSTEALLEEVQSVLARADLPFKHIRPTVDPRKPLTVVIGMGGLEDTHIREAIERLTVAFDHVHLDAPRIFVCNHDAFQFRQHALRPE